MLTIYETILLFKSIPKERLVESIKRTTGYVFEKNGFFRNIYYLGHQKIPYRQSKDKNAYWEAHYMFYEFNVTKSLLGEIADQWRRDRDLIKFTITPIGKDKPINFDMCTFEDEMKAVPYRSEVIKMVENAKAHAKNKDKSMKLSMSCHYYPFSR